MSVCVEVIEAKELPQFPLDLFPRSYVGICTDESKVKTRAFGDSQNYGSQSHSAPKWGEKMILPVTDLSGDVKLKVYTTTTTSIVNSMAMDHVLGKVHFPLPRVPCVDESQNQAIEPHELLIPFDSLDPVNSLASLDQVEGDTRTIPKLLATGRPIKLWLKLVKPKRAQILPMRARPSGPGRGQLCVILSLVPTPEDEIPFEDDSTDDEGDGDLATPLEEPPPPYDWAVIDEEFNCSTTKLHNLLFSNESEFFENFSRMKNYKDVNIDPWGSPESIADTIESVKPIGSTTDLISTSNKEPSLPHASSGSALSSTESGLKKGMVRRVKYLMPASGLIKAAVATETQTYLVAEPGGYIIDVRSDTPTVPYGDCFFTRVQFLINRIDAKKCRFRVSATMDFTKGTILRGRIEKATHAGMIQTYTEYTKLAQESLSRKKGKGTSPEEEEDIQVDTIQTDLITRLTRGSLNVPIPLVAIVLLLLLTSNILSINLYRANQRLQDFCGLY